MQIDSSKLNKKKCLLPQKTKKMAELEHPEIRGDLEDTKGDGDVSSDIVDEKTFSHESENTLCETPFVHENGENAWNQQVPEGSFVMSDNTLTWVEATKSTGSEIVLGDGQDWNEFSAWFADKTTEEETGEVFEIRNITEPHQKEVVFWEDGDHLLVEWVEMCICTFDDIVDRTIVAKSQSLIAKSIAEGYDEKDAEVPDSHTIAVGQCIDELRKFYVERIGIEAAFFKNKFNRECDYISPQAKEFEGEQFRVRISRGGVAIATHVETSQDVRIKFRNVRKLAKDDKHHLLSIKIKKRMRDASSKEEIQALLDFIRTIEPEEADNNLDKEEFAKRKEIWIAESEALLRSDELPDKPKETEEKKIRVIKGTYLPPIKLESWCNTAPKTDKKAMEISMLEGNNQIILQHEADEIAIVEHNKHAKKKGKKKKKRLPKCKFKKGQLTKDQTILLAATELNLSVTKRAQMTEEESIENQGEENLSLHRVHNLVSAQIPARLIAKNISCSNSPMRKWRPTHINVTLPVAIGISGLLEDDKQEMAVCEIGMISVYDAKRLLRYNHGKNALKCTEVYTYDERVKLVQCQVTDTHIGFLALCPDAVYQTVIVLNRKTGSVFNFTTKTCPMTSFLMDEDGEHVWLGFNHGLLIKMDIAARKRREQYWIGEEAPVQVIVKRRNRIIASTHKGVVLFNNGPGYENSESRVIMPIGPVLDMRFFGNFLIVHRPDNSLEFLNLLTADIEAFIPKSEQFETGEASSPYNSITLSEDHVAITFPEGNTLHFYV